MPSVRRGGGLLGAGVGGLGLFAAALELRDSVAEPRGLGLGRFEALAEVLAALAVLEVT